MVINIKFIDLYTIKARFAPALFSLFPSILLISLILNKMNYNLNIINKVNDYNLIIVYYISKKYYFYKTINLF